MSESIQQAACDTEESATGSAVDGFRWVYAELDMKPIAASRIAAGLLLPAILSLFTLHAETVRWSELAAMTNQQDTDYTVVTKNGVTLRDRRLIYSPLGLFLADSGSFVRREQVVEIRVSRHRESFAHAFFAPGGKMLHAIDPPSGQDWYIPTYAVFFLPVLLPVVLAIDVTAAPFTLPTEGVRRLRPARVIRVAQ